MRAALHQVFNSGRSMQYEVEVARRDGEPAGTSAAGARSTATARSWPALVVSSDVTRSERGARRLAGGDPRVGRRGDPRPRPTTASSLRRTRPSPACSVPPGMSCAGTTSTTSSTATTRRSAPRRRRMPRAPVAEARGRRAHGRRRVLAPRRHQLPGAVHLVADHRRRRAGGRRAHVQRRHGAQALRGAAPVPGRPRSAHGHLQPAPVRAGARAPPDLRRPLWQRRRRARARPRQLQVRQRQLRPQGGRRGDHPRRAHRRRPAPRDRHARAPGRRRVRDHPAGGRHR